MMFPSLFVGLKVVTAVMMVVVLVPCCLGFEQVFHLDDEESSLSSTTTNEAAAEIPLWPNNEVPLEHPGSIGKESIQCIDMPNCTDRRIRNVTIPTLTPYLVQGSDAAMIVAPGGGYGLLAIDREGHNIARWLQTTMGISAFVLKYRVPGRSWLPFGAAPLMDAQRAMGLIRNMASTDSNLLPNLNTSKIGFMGFSAGAHLTGHISVTWAGNRTYPVVDEADKQSCRPDYAMMIYPWRSVSQPPVNESISGASAVNVTHETPPTLLVQTQDDPVHVENAIYYYLALKDAGVSPAELHVYPRGGHGYGDCTAPGWRNDYEVCTWPDRAKSFLQTLGVIEREREREQHQRQRRQFNHLSSLGGWQQECD